MVIVLKAVDSREKYFQDNQDNQLEEFLPMLRVINSYVGLIRKTRSIILRKVKYLRKDNSIHWFSYLVKTETLVRFKTT